MCRHCELLLSEQEASLRGLQGQRSLFQLPTVLPVSGEHDEWIVSTLQETAVFVFLTEVMNRLHDVGYSGTTLTIHVT